MRDPGAVVRDQVWFQMWCPVEDQLWDQVQDQVWDQVWIPMWCQVESDHG